MEKFNVIVIGAGISGLSLAHYCAKAGMKTAVLEKSDRPGGSFHSHRVDDFWYELGAHTCYNSYGNLIGVIEGAGIKARMVPREKVSFKMVAGNDVKSIPSQLSFHELLSSAVRLFTLKKKGRSMESYYGRIVGMGNFDRVFGPAFNAVISQDARDFPAEMLFKKRPRRKDVLRKFSFDKGLQTVTDALATENNVSLFTGTEIGSIEFDGKVYHVAISDGRSFQSETLALAAPVTEAARLLSGSFPDVAAKLQTVKTAPVESMGAMVRKEVVLIPPCAGLIPVRDSFFSVVSRDTVNHSAYRGFTFHFRPGVLDRDAKIQRISQVLKVPAGRLEGIAEKQNIIPSLKVGHDCLMGDVDRMIQGKPLLLCGNYFDGVAIEDCVSRSLSEFNRLKRG